MVDVSVKPFEIEVRTRHGDLVRADVYLPEGVQGRCPVLLGASAYQKVLRPLPPVPSVFPFIEYGPIQLYLDQGYAYVAMDVPGTGRSEGTWDPVSRAEGEAIHDNQYENRQDSSDQRCGGWNGRGVLPALHRQRRHRRRDGHQRRGSVAADKLYRKRQAACQHGGYQ